MIPRPPMSTLFPYTTLFRSLRRARLPRLAGAAGVAHRAGGDGARSYEARQPPDDGDGIGADGPRGTRDGTGGGRSEEHTSELQSQSNLVCRLLLEKKKNKKQ